MSSIMFIGYSLDVSPNKMSPGVAGSNSVLVTEVSMLYPGQWVTSQILGLSQQVSVKSQRHMTDIAATSLLNHMVRQCHCCRNDLHLTSSVPL